VTAYLLSRLFRPSYLYLWTCFVALSQTTRESAVKMSTAIVVLLLILLALHVDTQLTVDGDHTGSCESSTSDVAVNLLREELKDVRLIREDFKNLETACTADHQQQQSVAVDTSGLCE